VAQTLREQGIALRRPLWVLDLLAEEPTDYGPSCVGSRAIAGTLDAAMLAACNAGGESLAEALHRMGGDPERLQAGPLYGPRPFAAFLELHIEQGPVLEREGVPIGVVSGVVGIRRLRLHVQGQADHAGTTPMPLRRDALVGAAELIRLVHRRAREAYETSGLVATVGHLAHTPNQANVVPASALLTLDVRCASARAIEAFSAAIVHEGRALVGEYALALTDTRVQDAAPTPFAEPVRAALRAAAQGRGHAWRDLQSGAGHDAMHIAARCPAGMVFVPSRGGRSHASEEFTDTAALARGVEVLGDAVLALDRSLPVA
jgi:N-carbamoyl-L-amino-acid hydrolase